jgi:DNA-binding HxlR family transcriptional regulator
MPARRRYDDGCAVAHALNLVGERWALLVVRELLLGAKRFTDLSSGLPGASSDVLTARLRELTDAGVVRRRRLPPPAASWVYELTTWGRELEPIVSALARWSIRSPAMRSDAPVGVDSAVLALKALFDPEAADGFTATLALRLAEQRFQVTIADGRIDVARGEPDHPDATLEADPPALLTLLRTDQPLGQLLTTGAPQSEADQLVIERFRRLFPRPRPAPLEDRT